MRRAWLPTCSQLGLAAVLASCATTPQPHAAGMTSADNASGDSASGDSASADSASGDNAPVPPPVIHVQPTEPVLASEASPAARVRVRLIAGLREVVDCGLDQAFSGLGCAFSSKGIRRGQAPRQTLRVLVTEPPGLILAASDWHPDDKLGEHKMAVASCRFVQRASVADAQIGPTDESHPGWFYGGRLPVGVLSGCHFSGKEDDAVLGAAHLLVMHDGSKRKPAHLVRSRQVALQRAFDTAEDLASGRPFADAAAAISDGPAGKRGGDLGKFRRSSMVPMFSLVASATPIGSHSPVFETVFGFHILERRR